MIVTLQINNIFSSILVIFNSFMNSSSIKSSQSYICELTCQDIQTITHMSSFHKTCTRVALPTIISRFYSSVIYRVSKVHQIFTHVERCLTCFIMRTVSRTSSAIGYDFLTYRTHIACFKCLILTIDRDQILRFDVSIPTVYKCCINDKRFTIFCKVRSIDT